MPRVPNIEQQISKRLSTLYNQRNRISRQIKRLERAAKVLENHTDSDESEKKTRSFVEAPRRKKRDAKVKA